MLTQIIDYLQQTGFLFIVKNPFYPN